VREDHDVDVFENPLAHEVRLARDQFFRDTGPHFDRAGKLAAFHLTFDGDRGEDVERHAGVVTFAVSGRAFDQRIVIRDAGFL